MPAIESRVEGVWLGKQTAKGTPALATATTNKRLRKVGGDINVNRDDGSENYSDGGRAADAADFVNTIVGEGAPVGQATADVAGYLAYLLLGAETVTGAADPYTHVATPGNTGFWFTAWKKVGSTIGPLRQKFSDCRMTSLRIEGSSANKVVKLTPTFTSVTNPGEVFTTDPVAVSSTEQPLLYTEGEGRFTIDGVVYRGHSSFAIVINDPTPPWYGDSVVPEDVTFGIFTVTLEGITILVNQQGYERYNTQIYGSANPAAGTQAIKTIPALGSYAVDLQRPVGGNLTTAGARQLKIEVPGVKWSPDLAIAGNPDGGPVEIALAGEARKSGTDPRVRVTTISGDAAYV